MREWGGGGGGGGAPPRGDRNGTPFLYLPLKRYTPFIYLLNFSLIESAVKGASARDLLKVPLIPK